MFHPTDKTIYLLLLDMSKAFERIQRNTLTEDLKIVLNQGELHFIQILLNVKIAAKCVNHKSRFFSTESGAPQGDFSSASKFTFYLAKSLETTIANETPSLEEHNNMQNDYPTVSFHQITKWTSTNNVQMTPAKYWPESVLQTK